MRYRASFLAYAFWVHKNATPKNWLMRVKGLIMVCANCNEIVHNTVDLIISSIIRMLIMCSHYSITRNDYSSLTSDIFQVVLLNVRPLILYLSNAWMSDQIKRQYGY